MPVKKKLFNIDDFVNGNPDDYQTVSDMNDIIGEESEYVPIDICEESNHDMEVDTGEISALKMMVSQHTQTQKARIALGNRIFAVFTQLLGIKPGTLVYENPEFKQLMMFIDKIEEEKPKKTTKKKEDKESIEKQNAKAGAKVIKYLRTEYKLITNAIAAAIFNAQQVELFNKNDILGTMVHNLSVSKLEKALYTIFKVNREKKDFKVIQNINLYHMVKSYIQYLNIEEQIYDQIKNVVHKFPLWYQYAAYIKGLGELTIACFLAKVDIHKCEKFTQLLAYAGYDTVLNPETGLREGRCNGFWKGKKHHQVTRLRPVRGGKKGEMEEYQSISYSPFIKTRVYLMGGNIIKAKNELYTSVFHEYKARLLERNKTMDKPRSNPHINMMALRYMNKFVLQDLWYHWRLIEGLSVTIPYPDAYLNHESHIRTFNMEQSIFRKTHPSIVIELVDWSKLDDPKLFSGQLLNKLREQSNTD